MDDCSYMKSDVGSIDCNHRVMKYVYEYWGGGYFLQPQPRDTLCHCVKRST
jgi:hypothetical protein